MRLVIFLPLSAICGSLLLFAQDPESQPVRESDRPTVKPEPQPVPEVQSLPAAVVKRLNYETPDEDELLFQLEKDYIELLKISDDPGHLLKAEDLLRNTNDSSHWTNYSAATKLLRKHRDKAAIPLLLRYLVLHAQRSSSHISIPEYAATISFISGHKIESPYEAGPDLPARMRVKVQAIVENWWSKNKDTLTTNPAEMDEDKLNVLLDGLFKLVRDSNRFDGSGGGQQTAYRAYHIVFYGVMHPSSDERLKNPVLHPKMTTMLLKRYGYREQPDKKLKPPPVSFPYEAISILSALREKGFADELDAIAADEKQNSTVRLLAILSIMDAGETLGTEDLLSLLETNLGVENHMIALLSLMEAGQEGVPVLLTNLKHPNIEICTAAACGLRRTRPLEALPLIDQRIRNNTNGQSLIMLFSALEEYQNEPGRRVLAALVRDSLNGEISNEYLDDALDAFEEACDQDWDRLSGLQNASDEVLARFALAWYQKHQADLQQRLDTLQAQVENAKRQFELAAKIAELRENEYKRLLLLQGEEIVDAAASSKAGELFKQAEEEARTHKQAIATLEAQLAALKAELGQE